MKKVLTSENAIGFGVAMIASVITIAIVFRLLPAAWRAKIVGA